MERAAFSISLSNRGVANPYAFDRNLIGDIDLFSGDGDHRLDERPKPALAKAPSKITAPQRLAHCGIVRRAYEDDIASDNRTRQRNDAPDAQGFARSRIDAEPANPASGRKSEKHASSSQHDADCTASVTAVIIYITIHALSLIHI